MKSIPIIQPAEIYAAGYTNDTLAHRISEILYACQEAGVFNQTICGDDRTALIHIAAREVRKELFREALDAAIRKAIPDYDERRAELERQQQKVAEINRRDPVTGLYRGQTYTVILAKAGVPDKDHTQFSKEALEAWNETPIPDVEWKHRTDFDS